MCGTLCRVGLWFLPVPSGRVRDTCMFEKSLRKYLVEIIIGFRQTEIEWCNILPFSPVLEDMRGLLTACAIC